MLLSPAQRHAAASLLALALRQSQADQFRPLATGEAVSDWTTAGGGDASRLWTHHSCGLLRPVFRFLEIDEDAWPGIEEIAASSAVDGHHVGLYLRIVFGEGTEESVERSDQRLALTKAVDATVMSWESASTSIVHTEERHQEVEHESHERINSSIKQESIKVSLKPSEATTTKALSGKDESLSQLNTSSTEENYQQKVVLLYELLSACVADTPQDNNKTSQYRKGYDARHRVALRLLTTWLDIKWIKMEAMETMVACSAMETVKEEAPAQESESEKDTWSEWKRGGIIGAAALTGGTLLAVTGGLAAPAIAAGFSALGFSAVASATGSVAGSVAVAASFGAAGAGLSGSKMAKRIGSIEEFEFKPIGGNHNQGRLAVGILISGFVFEEEDFIRPWEGWEDNLERYALQWESQYLIAVNTAIQDWITSRVAKELMRQGAMMTVLSTLVTALAWPAALLAATDFIDSEWSMAIDRSDKAGKLLAEVLLNGLQGNRPVTLFGFSLGARVIFKCLQHLAESGDNEGLIERVVLLGAPISLEGEQWENARKMVAGRFVNAYSANDWILGVTFRASLLSQGLAGIQAVDVPGVENVDVSDLIDGHSSYLCTVPRILEQLEIDCYYPFFTSALAKSEEGKIVV